MLIGLGVLSIFVLTLATAWFVLQEFAYVSVDRGKLQGRADRGDPAAVRALALTERLSFVLSGAQLGITVTTLLVGYVSEPLLGEGIAGALGFTDWPYSARLSLSLIATLMFSTLLQMVLGELAPKNLAIAAPERLARGLSRSTAAYLWLAGPVIRLFDGLSNAVLRRVGIQPVEELPQGATPEELDRIVEESHHGGLVDQRLADLLQHALSFAELRVEQVMTPRVDVQVVRSDAPARRIVELLSTGRSRFPVVDEDIDDVAGVAGVTELLTVPPTERGTRPIAQIASPAVTVPATLPLPDALERLRQERRQMALVIDEYGGFAGVVTFEDLAEQVVGPILDEDDPDEPLPRQLPQGWSVPGRLRLEELEDLTGWCVTDPGDFATVGGLVLDRLGRTAAVGDQVPVSARAGNAFDAPVVALCLQVREVHRHVPHRVVLTEAPAGTARTAGSGS